MVEADKNILFNHFLDPMRLIYAVLILLLVLMTSAQCQQTAEDWLKKGNDLADQGKYDEAIQAYDEAIKLDPNCAKAYVGKDNVLADPSEAIQAYDEAIRLEPNDAQNWNDKGSGLHP